MIPEIIGFLILGFPLALLLWGLVVLMVLEIMETIKERF